MSLPMRPTSVRKPSWNDLIPIPIDLIQKDEKLPFPVYLKIMERPVLFRTVGDEITSDRADRLKEKIESVCIPRAALSELIARQETTLGQSGDNEAVEQLKNLLHTISSEMEITKELSYDHLQRVEKLAGTLATLLRKQPARGQSLIRRYDDSRLYFASHSVNVAIYAVMIGIKLNLPLERLKVLALGALLHNIGNMFVPEEVLHKTSPLTVAEWRQVQEHPQKGAALLAAFRVPHEVLLMIEQHHERIDGKGYPMALSGNQIHLFSRICAIADVYDALTSTRPYRRSISPYEALKIMRQMTGKFDTNILRAMEGRSEAL